MKEVRSIKKKKTSGEESQEEEKETGRKYDPERSGLQRVRHLTE